MVVSWLSMSGRRDYGAIRGMANRVSWVVGLGTIRGIVDMGVSWVFVSGRRDYGAIRGIASRESWVVGSGTREINTIGAFAGRALWVAVSGTRDTGTIGGIAARASWVARMGMRADGTIGGTTIAGHGGGYWAMGGGKTAARVAIRGIARLGLGYGAVAGSIARRAGWFSV